MVRLPTKSTFQSGSLSRCSLITAPGACSAKSEIGSGSNVVNERRTGLEGKGLIDVEHQRRVRTFGKRELIGHAPAREQVVTVADGAGDRPTRILDRRWDFVCPGSRLR